MSQNSLGLRCISLKTQNMKYLSFELRITSVNLDDLTGVFYKDRFLKKTSNTAFSLGTFNKT